MANLANLLSDDNMTRDAVEKRDQEERGQISPSILMPCSNGCGHFESNPEMSLCSKCNAEFEKFTAKTKKGEENDLPTLSPAGVEKAEHMPQRNDAGSKGESSSSENEGKCAERLPYSGTERNYVHTTVLEGVSEIDEFRENWSGKSSEFFSQSSEEEDQKRFPACGKYFKADFVKSYRKKWDLSRSKQPPVVQPNSIVSDDVIKLQSRQDQLPEIVQLSTHITKEKVQQILSSQLANEKVEQSQNLDVSSSNRVQAEKRPQPRNFCQSCRKRIGLTGFKCRCGNMYCSIHRYSDMHTCSYDYKLAGRNAIAKANPLTVASKVIRI